MSGVVHVAHHLQDDQVDARSREDVGLLAQHLAQARD
jgi:hypothetical protein